MLAGPTKPLKRVEFIVLMALISAGTAFSLDAMLPAFPSIAADLSPKNPERAALVVATFVLGLGVGTLFSGPLSDAWGRRPVILWGSALFAGASALAIWAETLEAVLLARVLAGLGAAGPRVCGMAIVRDLYEGRQMARVLSFIMVVFTLVPAVAPVIGLGLLALGSWRYIFAAFVVFVATYALWFLLRQPETLPADRRRPLRPALLWAALREVLATRETRIATLVQGCAFGMLFGTLSSVQPIFDQTFGAADSFVWYWLPISALAACASFANARLVPRLGMRRIVLATMATEVALSLGMLAAWAGGVPGFFWLFLLWQLSIFCMAGLSIGNLNALALHPLGHIAGMASSVVTSVATILGAVIAGTVGLLFDGTPVPLLAGVALAAATALALIRALSHQPQVA